jgi:hypothetical protein
MAGRHLLRLRRADAAAIGRPDPLFWGEFTTPEASAELSRHVNEAAILCIGTGRRFQAAGKAACALGKFKCVKHGPTHVSNGNQVPHGYQGSNRNQGRRPDFEWIHKVARNARAQKLNGIPEITGPNLSFELYKETI